MKEVLKDLLKRNNLRLGDLEREMKLGHSTLWRRVTGKSPWRLNELYYLSEKLGVYFHVDDKGMTVFIKCETLDVSQEDFNKLSGL